MEQLDRVAGRVVEHDLHAARTGDDVAPEPDAGASHPLHLGGDVADDQVDPVPAARAGLDPVGHRSPGGARPSAQEQLEAAAHDVREGRKVRADTEAEVRGVEADGRIDVVDHVADADQILRHAPCSPYRATRLGSYKSFCHNWSMT